MAIHWLLFLAFVAPLGVVADGLDDFSNNLATDLGPLLVLFGDAMTKQYLSECTSFLDYFIFAMAPVGVLTAMSAAIRVCGHSTLRAFIGRSQEGQGTVEAELCTSTGRDVCELFTRGGITRALGRPSILELVHVPGSKDDEGDEVGVHSFNHWVGAKGEGRWHLAEEGKQRQQESVWREGLLASHPPNISLNVGIVKRPKYVFIAVAVTGFICQAGLIGLAASGGWKLEWTVNKSGTPSSSIYAPIMYCIGSVLMSLGMWGCAAVIGQTTDEIQYKRRPEELKKPQTRLFWLQPGPQFIGDQCFDSFAYTEAEPLETWKSSTRNSNYNFILHSTVAVTATLAGYIMQFIGLRGMKAWLSLAQLGSSICMSILRGGLRAQRLSRKANRLAENPEVPDAVAGHELDWMAFELHQTGSKEWPKKKPAIEEQTGPTKQVLWHITGQYEKALVVARKDGDAGPKPSSPVKQSSLPDMDSIKGTGSQCVVQIDSPTPRRPEGQGRSQGSLSAVSQSETLKDATMSTVSQKSEKDPTSCMDLLRVRVRLAHLTGHVPFGETVKEGQKWKNNHVKVRAKAYQVSSAICQAAAKLVPKPDRNKDIMLQIIGSTSTISNTHGETTTHNQTLGVALKPPSESTLAGWQIDSARVEAILGLWMWSIVSDGREVDQVCFRNENIPTKSITSAGSDIQQELIFWLGSQSVAVTKAALQLDKTPSHGLIDLWRNHDKSTKQIPRREVRDNGQRENREVAQKDSDDTSDTLSDDVSETANNSTSGKSQSSILKKVDVDASNQKDVALRLCGWSSIYEALALEKASDSTARHHAVRMFPAIGSLLDICARELFAALAASLTSIVHVARPTLVNRQGGDVLLQSETVAILTTALIENGLGSHADALISVIPAVGKQLAVPTNEAPLSSVIATANIYRWRGEWSWAEKLLRLACHSYSPSNDQEATATTGGSSEFAQALRATGELYRWALRESKSGGTDAEAFGRAGIDWMHGMYQCKGSADEEITQILGRYRHVQKEMAMKSSFSDLELRDRLVWAIAHQRKDDQNARSVALYCLCLVQDCRHESLQRVMPLAVQNGWDEVAGSMLEMGADVNVRDEGGKTALLYCVETGQDVEQYIGAGADVKVQAIDGSMPLHLAASFGYHSVAERLISAGAAVNATNNVGHTPLYEAVMHGQTAVAKRLVDAGALVNTKAPDGSTPLHMAAQHGHEAMVEYLISANAGVNAKANGNHTPLHEAAWHGHTGVVRRLVDAGAVVDARSMHSRTALDMAAIRGHNAMTEYLIAVGANVKGLEGCTLPTPLHEAARRGHTTVAKHLVDAGASVDARTGEGKTPLHMASEANKASTAQFLLDAGASIGAMTVEGCTPLHLAEQSRSKESAELLVARGAGRGVKGHGTRRLRRPRKRRARVL